MESLELHRRETDERFRGARFRVEGDEEWTIAPDGLIAESRGHYDQAGYDRQLQHGDDPGN